MIHSRPGFAPRRSDETVARLNEDMIPAINRIKTETPSPVKHTNLQSKADYAFEKLRKAREATALAEAQAAAAKVGPELLVNPAPSAPPVVLEPGK
jgi:hypothetical protein